MIVQRIEHMRQSTPLIKPFKTALRTVGYVESVLVRVSRKAEDSVGVKCLLRLLLQEIA
jgi:hypothetical protein